MRENSIAVLGLQWGDEGKGKIVDFLSENCDAVVRFGGGSNAGHTIVVEGEKFILRLLPSGILHPGKLCLIGTGVACDPEVLVSEIENLEKRGISVSGRIFVDYATQLVLPQHKARDGAEEDCRGKGAIDTTKRGIGPSYADRASRIGIRVADLFHPNMLEQKAENLIRFHCTSETPNEIARQKTALINYLENFKPLFKPLIADVATTLMDLVDSGRPVLFEGAQGSLLDIDYGTYPYTTSSHTTIGGIFTGLGLPTTYVGKVIGVVKAYLTRVGHGPFPTEIEAELGSGLRERGAEFGSVTGRPRRVGWLDLALLKRIVKLNGVERLAVTKLDVLDGISKIDICEKYNVDGQEINIVPPNHPDFFKARPVYTSLEGWTSPVAGKTKIEDLPKQARAYLDFIEEKSGVKIWLISTGYRREDTIIVD